MTWQIPHSSMTMNLIWHSCTDSNNSLQGAWRFTIPVLNLWLLSTWAYHFSEEQQHPEDIFCWQIPHTQRSNYLCSSGVLFFFKLPLASWHMVCSELWSLSLSAPACLPKSALSPAVAKQSSLSSRGLELDGHMKVGEHWWLSERWNMSLCFSKTKL